MGVVYMAEQLQGVNRRVALKIIKLGMDTRQVIARFEVERQAMAMFDHSNITRVFDAGATETGRPYFVMELVRGTDILTFSNNNNIDQQKRLELFVTVCNAVQHSHQKGIIHRDLKPSNILITYIDGMPTPKVIDFGIAKALDQRLTEKTLFTHYSAIMGTPQYMSPEQAELSGTDVDTRSDIYSLGIVLYELITGSTPLKKDDLNRLPPMALLDTIRQHNIETPSIRLAKQHSRNVPGTPQPPTQSHGIPRELDCIVMKAIDRDRTRRYPSATELAADIQRFLDGDPVEAVAPSRFYRFQTYLSKHRNAVLAIVGVGLLLVATSVVCTLFALGNYRANKIKDQTVVQLSDALRDLKVKHSELIVAERTIRESAENQLYQAAMESALAKYDWIFYREIAHLLPTYVDQGSFSRAEDEETIQQEPLRFVQMVPPNYIDYSTLYNLKNRHLVEAELNRLEVFAKTFSKKVIVDNGHVDPSTQITAELKATLAQKTIGCRNQFYRVLLKEYRLAFGDQDPRIANTLNLLALSLIESERFSEAEACLGNAMAISKEPKTNTTSRQLLKMAQSQNSSYTPPVSD